jgi:hypothetical protein
MTVNRILVALAALALLSAPAFADDSRDRVRMIKALARASSDPAIVESVEILDREGLLRGAPRSPVSSQAVEASRTLCSKRFDVLLLDLEDQEAGDSPGAPRAPEDTSSKVGWKEAREIAIEYFKKIGRASCRDRV